MEFRTAISIQPSMDKIRLDSSLLSIGSCFSTCIGNKLANNKFDVLVNPFGTVFNPVSIFRLVNYALSGNIPRPETYVERDGIWRNIDFHSDFSDRDKGQLEAMIAEKLEAVRRKLSRLTHMIVTPGTAWVYETKQTNYLASNCHKLPPGYFHPKRLLEVDEIVGSFSALYNQIHAINPHIKYIFTVSPVRHVRDTLELNTLSKASLRLAIKKLQQKFSAVDYFPSYEIMMDDLRDYRFYESDMIHPNSTAEDYIWEKFSYRYFESETISFINKWQKIRQAVSHRPYHPDSEAYKAFLEKTIEQVASLAGIINVDEELAALKNRRQ